MTNAEFEKIYQTYFNDVYLFIRNLSGSTQLAEEITSETFFKAIKSIDCFRGDCDVRVWLCQIAKNCYYSYLRKHGKVDTSGELASEDSCHLIEDHLKNCPSCKMLYDNMKKQQKLPSSACTVPLKKLRKHLLMKKAETIVFVAVLVFSLMVTIFAYLSSPDYIPYSDSVVSCQRTNNAILVKFRSDVTRYSVSYDTDGNGNKCARIQAWYTSLDNFFPGAADKTALLTSIPGSVKSIWYCSSNGTEDKLIYGEPELGFGGRITLPKLALGYYTLIAFILAVTGGILLFVFRNNNKIKDIIEKIVFVPVSYLIGHICIKGFNTISYSAPRDLSLILLVSILVYCLLITGQSLWKRALQGNNQEL